MDGGQNGGQMIIGYLKSDGGYLKSDGWWVTTNQVSQVMGWQSTKVTGIIVWTRLKNCLQVPEVGYFGS